MIVTHRVDGAFEDDGSCTGSVECALRERQPALAARAFPWSLGKSVEVLDRRLDVRIGEVALEYLQGGIAVLGTIRLGPAVQPLRQGRGARKISVGREVVRMSHAGRQRDETHRP